MEYLDLDRHPYELIGVLQASVYIIEIKHHNLLILNSLSRRIRQ